MDNLFKFTRPGSGKKEIRIDNIKKVTETDGKIAGPAVRQVPIPPSPLGKTRTFLSRASYHTFKNLFHVLNSFWERPPKVERAKMTKMTLVHGVEHKR